MKYIKIVHIIICFLLISCTSNTILKKPDNLIPPNKMEDLLTDMFIASGAKRTTNVLGKRNINYYPAIFKKYKIDSAQFKRSNYYYTSKIDAYDVILMEVEKRLKYKRDSISSILHIQDSLKNIITKNKTLLRQDKQKLLAYDAIFKKVNKFNDSILKVRDSLANYLCPLLKIKQEETTIQTLPYTFIDFQKTISVPILKKKQQEFTSTITVLKQLKKRLNKEASNEILQEIRWRKDSVNYFFKKIKKDTIVYFPIKVQQKDTIVVLDSSYITANKNIEILKRIEADLRVKKQDLKYDVKKRDSILKIETKRNKVTQQF